MSISRCAATHDYTCISACCSVKCAYHRQQNFFTQPKTFGRWKSIAGRMDASKSKARKWWHRACQLNQQKWERMQPDSGDETKDKNLCDLTIAKSTTATSLHGAAERKKEFIDCIHKSNRIQHDWFAAHPN